MLKIIAVCAALCACFPVFAQTDDKPATLIEAPAHAWPAPERKMMLDATRAGTRIVAVGEHGIVLLSDDDGQSFRQAAKVPVSSTLTAVTFSDAEHGWAAGHWGTIIATQDGGETWKLQRVDTSTDQPLFSVDFLDAREGFAAGLWSLLLATHDGGSTWTRVPVPKPVGDSRADRNLYRVFSDHANAIYITAEQGSVLRSRDGGANWSWLETGGKGSLWAGTAAPDGRLMVGGLLGNTFESRDGGQTWSHMDSHSSGSITDLVATRGGVVGVGLDGFVLEARNGAPNFSAIQRADRAALTAVVTNGKNTLVLFSKDGVIRR
ncbi:WD40/YVTN/BNR-like repeat-containing protein [Paraburkholderia guartelaensis]|uniref:WD40/YVTN/BNR-like repeat-containing protein n=1 Tax=Paraburkholderia guartelaensis TaxID=2546446 RepID=UPI002AB6BB4E|nr:YCF48-related protein [Paraburkholderia guartelaensis]